ncbi:hypothetical protein B0H16DRAFT_1672856 [Mycena metata]|uniref:Uncharacterized protein n=1 Tax=Mycena metata TaxID=1033252 RepID=A0AAD7NSW7_9AGAR|nr:hypothetical protein B0H16DRAFT_1672856 [Mycena metata]
MMLNQNEEVLLNHSVVLCYRGHTLGPSPISTCAAGRSWPAVGGTNYSSSRLFYSSCSRHYASVTWEFEKNLPQHNLDLPFPEGKTGRYVKFSNQANRLGWNNCFNEILMNTHLAYMSKRAYVFSSYMWALQHYPWPESERLSEQPVTPLNALLSGPSVGGSWDEGDDAPRSVSQEWWEVVCPESERRIVVSDEMKPYIGAAEGDKIFEFWQKFLLDAPERCIEIVPVAFDIDNFPQVFDLWLWGSTRIISLWDSFSKSPASRLLESSPIVESAVVRNKHLFLPRGPKGGPHDPFQRMLAMHIRRGDYKKSCENLASFGSTFYSWDLLPILPDVFTPLPEGHPDRIARAMEHCSPGTDAILKKVRDARADYLHASQGHSQTLDVLYILTNEHDEWFDELEEVLGKDGWATIVTSHDLKLDSEQTEVSGAVDMDIARRAAVFIGNGWSSFTSNIVHRRLVDGKLPISIRFY